MDLRLFERIFDSLVSSISWIKNQEDGEKIIEEFFIPLFEREEVSYVYNRKYTAKVKFLTNGKYQCTCWFHRIEESFYWSDDFIKRNLDLFSVEFITKNKLYLKPNFKKLLDDTIKMRIKDSISSTISEYYPDYLKCFEVDIKFDSETFYLLNEIRDGLSEKEKYPLEEIAEERKYSEEDDPDLNLYYYYCNIGNETSGFIE